MRKPSFNTIDIICRVMTAIGCGLGAFVPLAFRSGTMPGVIVCAVLAACLLLPLWIRWVCWRCHSCNVRVWTNGLVRSIKKLEQCPGCGEKINWE